MSVTVAGVADADILNDAKTPKDVVSYGMGPHQQAVDVKTGEKIREYNGQGRAWRQTLADYVVAGMTTAQA